MAASPYRRFSSICPTVQALLIRLIQEEFTPLLPFASEAPVAAWVRAITLADPSFLYCAAQEPVIRICPESYKQLQEYLEQELVPAA